MPIEIDMKNLDLKEKVKKLCERFEKGVNEMEEKGLFCVIAMREEAGLGTLVLSENMNFIEQLQITSNIFNKLLEQLNKQHMGESPEV